MGKSDAKAQLAYGVLREPCANAAIARAIVYYGDTPMRRIAAGLSLSYYIGQIVDASLSLGGEVLYPAEAIGEAW
jgi:hypothetical protein